MVPSEKRRSFSPTQGIGTLVTHAFEGDNPHHAHVSPIFQTSTYVFPDVAAAAAMGRGEREGYLYARYGSPNTDQAARKIALLEGLELARSRPEADIDDLVAGRLFSSGMAAISSGVLARVRAGETIVSQRSVYGNTYVLFHDVAPRLGIKVVWVSDVTAGGWEEALAENPGARLVYAETPANPTMMVVDLALVAEIAHRHGCWLMVDNTFASPYCQRPLALGADIVVHSTTKYISGHGALIGGALVSPRLEYMRDEVKGMIRVLGGAPAAFDAWLTNLGLKTFELRMKRHCENATAVAEYLAGHPGVERVFYPGLRDDPGHEIALRQMHGFGGMLSFELRGGIEAGETLMNHLRLASLAVSLGNVDSLVQHPASMTHRGVPPEERRKMGIGDGLVRLSVGIENVEDIINDLEEALRAVK